MKPDSDPLKDLEFERILEWLRDAPPPVPHDGFTDAVLNRLKKKKTLRHLHFAICKKAAAVAAVFLLATGLWMTNQGVKTTEQSPLQILMSCQGQDGGWTSGAIAGHSRYDTGVTALALMVLLRTDSLQDGTAQQKAIHAGVTHLLSQQTEDGSFPDSSSRIPYTRYLAGMALQLAAQDPNAPQEWHDAAAQAAAHLPPVTQMAQLNQRLSHPECFPARWAEAGGSATMAAIQLLQQ